MTTKYAVRSISYPNHEEGFDTSNPTPTIKQIFDTKEEAEQELKQLLVMSFQNSAKDENYLRHFDIFNDEVWGDFSERLEKVNQFYQEKTGKEFNDISDIINLDLNDDDIIKFVNLAGINEFDMIEIDSNEYFYVVWINRKQDYMKLYGEKLPLTFESDELPVNVNDDSLVMTIADELNENAPKGELHEISDNPEALQKIIDRIGYVWYSNDELNIELNFWRGKDFSSLKYINDYLKEPWFEVKMISQAELEQFQNENK